MARKEEIGVGLLLVGGLAATGFLALQTGALSSFGDAIEVEAKGSDAAGLMTGSKVMALGVEVGEVTGIDLEEGRVVVRMSLDPAAEIRVDAQPKIRSRSLLGEKYVEIDPGSPTAALLADDDELREIPPQFEVDELVDALGDLLRTLDPALLGDLGQIFSDLHESDPERLGRMVDDLERLVHNARLASEDLPVLVADARTTLGVARVTLASVDARANEAKDTLARADALLVKLDQAADPLPETIAEARQALIEARAVIAKLDGATDELDAVLANLESFDVDKVESLLRDEGIRVRFAGRGKAR